MISIIIPVYNVSKYIDKCICSVVNQTEKDIEIILINDGSTDDSLLICDKWKKQDSRIIIYNQVNLGLSAARNQGLKISSGDYVFFLDSDDYIKDDCIEILYNNLIKTNADMVIGNNKRIFENQCEITAISSVEQKIYDTHERYSVYWDYPHLIMACNKLYRKKIFDEINFPINKINEDEFIAHLVLDKCMKMLNILQ